MLKKMKITEGGYEKNLYILYILIRSIDNVGFPMYRF